MAAKRLTTTQAYTLLSVLCALFLAALDQTIVATAAPPIATDLNGFEAISWIFSAYMLASTVMIPIYGKLSDIYGRRIFYFGGILVFLVGSVLCGMAFNMPWLIIARVVQGLGAGAIMVESFTIIGDIFPPAERGKWQGLISGIFGLASIIGPLLGGVLTDYASWRWVFYINIPIGVVALLLVHKHFPAALKKGSHENINYPSAVLLAFSLLSFLFALVQSEHQGRIFTVDNMGLFFASAMAFGVFIFRDRRARHPIFPKLLFQNRIFNLSIVSLFFTSICMFGIISYIPLFVQMALHGSPSKSGVALIPFVVSMTIAAAIAGQLVSRLGKYKALLIFGLSSFCLGIFLLTHVDTATTSRMLTTDLIFVGAGLGITMPIYMVIVQSSFSHDKLGIVTSSTQLIRNIGSTLGTALLGTLIITYVEKKLLNKQISFGDDARSLTNFSQMLKSVQSQTNDEGTILLVRESFAEATSLVLRFCLALAVLTLILALFMPIIRLRKTNGPMSE